MSSNPLKAFKKLTNYRFFNYLYQTLSCQDTYCFWQPSTFSIATSGLSIQEPLRQGTVNSEIFERILFSRNFAYAKFRENKILAKCWNHYGVYWYM